MRFLIDVQLPLRLVPWLAARGCRAEHALELGLGQANDETLWRRAIDTDAVLLSKDEDFADKVRTGRLGPQVVWLRTGNGTTSELLKFLEPVWPAVIQRLQVGDRLIEVR